VYVLSFLCVAAVVDGLRPRSRGCGGGTEIQCAFWVVRAYMSQYQVPIYSYVYPLVASPVECLCVVCLLLSVSAV
jgi:hypothetical protein